MTIIIRIMERLWRADLRIRKTEYVSVEYPPTSEIIVKIEKLNQEVEKETAEFKKLLGL